MIAWMGKARKDAILAEELLAVNGCQGRVNPFIFSVVATGKWHDPISSVTSMLM